MLTGMTRPPLPPGLYAETVEIIPAATVVVFRRAGNGGPPELLLLQRAKEMRFAGGATVFPGGRIDPADHALAARLATPGIAPDELAARIAAVRETLEESGLLLGLAHPVDAAEVANARLDLIAQGALGPVLARRGWRLAPETLVPFARWSPAHARAFDTRFYLYDLGKGDVDVAVDATENTRLFWLSAAEALAQADRGVIGVIYPTRRNLERLALFADFAAARAQAEAIAVTRITPRPEWRDGAWWLSFPEGLGYPVCAEPVETMSYAVLRQPPVSMGGG